MMNGPLVSINVVNYNNAAYLPAALDSMLAQTYSNIEITICDDASTDGSANIIADYVARYPGKIYSAIAEKNLGIVKNIIRAIQSGTGKYSCIFSGDDIMHADKIALQVALMEKNPDAGLCYHDLAYFEDDISASFDRHSNRILPGTSFAELIALNPVGAPSNMLRRDWAAEITYPEQFPFTLDWLMWILMCASHTAIYIPKPLVYYRRHKGNFSTSRQKQSNVNQEIIETYRWLLAQDFLDLNQRSFVRAALALKMLHVALQTRHIPSILKNLVSFMAGGLSSAKILYITLKTRIACCA